PPGFSEMPVRFTTQSAPYPRTCIPQETWGIRAMTRKKGDQRGSAGFWVRGVAEALKAEGLDVAVLFDEAGLDVVALSDPDSRFPTEKVSLLWHLAVARSGAPAMGLANSSTAKPASFDVVAYTMLSSPNLLGILERLSRYVGIVSDAASLVV